MNILITGGAGFIGSHIADALISRGHDVVIIDNLSTGERLNIPSNSNFILRDINHSLDDIFKRYQFDVVFHLAAQINLRHSILNPHEDAMNNIMGSLNIFDNCIRTNVKKVVFSSTGGAMYSSIADKRDSWILPFSETSLANPSSPYGLSKLTAENYLLLFGKLNGLSSTILRYSNVFGPRQNSKGEAGVISIFIEKALQGKDMTIFGNGEQTRDFIYIDDVVNANMLAMDSSLNGIFNVSSNYQYSINEIAEKIRDMTKSASAIAHIKSIDGELLHTRLSYDKLGAYGWKPNQNIDDGILKTIDYFKDKS